jgi:hypothetical protein
VHPLLEALIPVADELGATLVERDELAPGDVPLRWRAQVVGGFRMPGLQGALERMIATVERELGSDLASMSREDKQLAIGLLSERGAFTLRKAVEDVADAMGVSRFTVYNYLSGLGER